MLELPRWTIFLTLTIIAAISVCAVSLNEILRRLEKFHADYRRVNKLDGTG